MHRLNLAAALLWALASVAPAQDNTYSGHWDRGLAELNRFELTQSRYGQPRDGYAVLVFVAEDFRPERQVKAESGRGDSVRVLKLNRIQRFTTGIYDYSLMQSVFTPSDRARHPATLKTSTSMQDWCGHVWAQLNRRGDAYRLTGHSYFESEADESRDIDGALLEDEIFNVIRIDPAALPIGKVDAIPGMFDARLRHTTLRVEPAEAERKTDGDTSTYRLIYRSGRVFEVEYETARPHGILRFAERIGRQVTEARRVHVEMNAYWNRSGRSSDADRTRLGLEPGDIGRADKER